MRRDAWCHSRKKRATPVTEMTAPATLRAVTGWWSSQCAGAMMMMGVRAIRVLATPALVYCNASSEQPTPTNGPKTVVRVAAVRLTRSVRLRLSGSHPTFHRSSSVKPTMPATQRKKLAKNGRIPRMCYPRQIPTSWRPGQGQALQEGSVE